MNRFFAAVESGGDQAQGGQAFGTILQQWGDRLDLLGGHPGQAVGSRRLVDIGAGTWGADIIITLAETRLLRLAAERGLPVQPGISMLNEQIGCYRAFFSL